MRRIAEIPPLFVLALLDHVGNFPKVWFDDSTVRYADIYGFAADSAEVRCSLIYSGSYDTFQVLQTTKSLSFGLEPPAHRAFTGFVS